MHRVFISYKKKDQIDLFDALVLRLEKANYEVWTDRRLIAGEAWMQAIDNAINDAFAIVVIMTKGAQESQYVTYEWSYALGAGKPLITLMVGNDVVLHPRLRDFQYTDFTDDKRPWDEILNGLEGIARNLRETQQEQAFRWMQDGDAELEYDDPINALDSYKNAYDLADDRLRVRIGYKMARLYIRQIEKTADADEKTDLLGKAEALLTSALAIRPNYYAARAFLGYIYRLKRDLVTGPQRQEALEKARANFEAALTSQPDLTDHLGESWWNTYGGVLRRLGDALKNEDAEAANAFYDQAISAYSKAIQYGKKSSYPYGNLAVLYMLKGDPANMTRNYARVEYYPPSDAGDFWSHGDQLIAYLLRNDRVKIDEEFARYDAFAPLNARSTLLETLRSIARLLDSAHAEVITTFINQISATIPVQAPTT